VEDTSCLVEEPARGLLVLFQFSGYIAKMFAFWQSGALKISFFSSYADAGGCWSFHEGASSCFSRGVRVSPIFAKKTRD